ncbi:MULTISPECIES: 2-amino-4-hydroxy-6-hydroxymethyldihydropteridine diphosphokinase [unclassified Vibrio]|jgi:2-amino-4-hydroxy-6-hydroxymethyldihydropteridine diphosphokinase|uniref:2-amino-4-hydroxy-6- hydroxymethyldihydropteridine diphosphokinase n=1 Tax=unclassified Vibrio TaxID=2614977 RepID=UPI000B8E3C07|nr:MULTISPECIES: 2-amino-4-hydroxy-6-hydroxymethyldihydropteridine diphosphokinase [unclassified Vibrio]MDQ2190446.1 2-amino-4-hydroxy-6-hydroxymethyldihydropteridine diphosphokinase [Vibrio sp. A14(2019)]MDQ2196075.1 2-amino-4-hydroxy-6-hydroxymethyldihydropteridine diphosphokinase [Vibrio sp. 2017_1457_11]NAW89353.1 2-amino-4-hydroxy-6-hydroxymethyldihydropteridine diphosphokinase [Vibrio sp. V24_P1S3T111]NNN75059.1 2-amino-4-hydroxy-6-hydroxymethyldihydropteridine diphosphokinase [Vibrio sp.
MTTVYVGVGSNIERRKHIEVAIEELSTIGNHLQISTIYECASVGFNSAAFYNLVVALETRLSLSDFVAQLRAIESRWGRDPQAKKFQDRTLDLDIILFGEEISAQDPELPRSDIFKYPFVIQPLYDLSPERIVPNDGRSVRQIWQQAINLESLTPVKLWFDIN